mgnify:FL=1
MARNDPRRTLAATRALDRGWTAKAVKGSKLMVRCPYGCCTVTISSADNGRARDNQLAQIERCPGRLKALDTVIDEVDTFLETGKPVEHQQVVLALPLSAVRVAPPPPEPDDPVADPKPDPDPPTEATAPDTTTLGRETPMAKRPDRPEFYELIADYFCENADTLISITRLADALGVDGEDAEYAGSVMGALHDNTMRRVLGASAEKSAANTAYHRFRAKGGLFYRAATGAYVLDTEASVTNNHLISGNRWPVLLGNVPRTVNAGKNHRYRNLVELAPQGTPPTPAPLPTPPTPDPTLDEATETPAAAPAPVGDVARRTPAADRQRPPSELPPVTPAVAPMGQVVTLLARDPESGSIMLRIGDEIVTAQITSSMQVVG